MAYATPADVRLRLPQVGADADLLLAEELEAATTMIKQDLGYSFADYSTAAARTVYAWGEDALRLPAHQAGSITLVTALGSLTPITGWAESDDGSLVYITPLPHPLPSPWGFGAYEVTAVWGYGPVPADIKQVCIEIAVNLWREKDKGMYSDVIGVEGEGAVAVGYARAFTNRQRAILDSYKVTGVKAGTLQL